MAAWGLCLDGGAVAVRSSSVSVEIDAANGRVTGLRAANGVEFAAPDGCADLFNLGLTRPEDYRAAENVTPAQAARFRHEPLAQMPVEKSRSASTTIRLRPKRSAATPANGTTTP